MASPRVLEPGRVVAGRYRIAERLGGGGMGDVYRAEHTLAGRTVAIKLLRPELAGDETHTQRFFQEAQAVNRIRHPNIVDVLDAGFSEDGPYVAMECLEGASLAAAIARVGRFEPGVAVAVLLPILEALEAAHWRGIIHRDLKPENLFLADVAREVRVKILDFGIAKVTDPGEGAANPRTRTGTVFGTPDYLSPEQARGDSLVDGRSDVFAAATVLYEMLTSERPFSASTMLATAYKIANDPAPRLADRGVVAVARLQETLDLAMTKRPEERVASAASLAERLAPFAAPEADRQSALRAILDMTLATEPTQAVPALDRARAALDDASSAPNAAAPPKPEPTPKADLQPSGERVHRSPTLASGSALPNAEHTPSARRPIPRWLLDGKEASPSPAQTPSPSAPRVATGPRTPLRPRPSKPQPSSPAIAPSLAPTARGRCHARGLFARSIAQWIERTYGASRLADVLAIIPRAHADAFRADTFNALAWYAIDEVDSILDATTASILGGDAGGWRKLARDHFDRGLGPILRPSQHVGDAERAVKRAPSGWQRIFDFGAMRVSDAISTGRLARVEIHVADFEGASSAIRNVHLGTMEALLRSAGAKDVGTRVLSGETSFARELVYELAWSGR